MPRLLLEPRAVPGGRRSRPVHAPCAEARPASINLTTPQLADPARARSALAAAAFAACVVGLLGVEAGVIWIVAGVWTLRSLEGEAPGVAWGLACVGAAVRWGATGLGDVEVATTLLGASVAAGPVIVRVGLGLALAGAVISESDLDGLRSHSLPQQAAAVVALVVLVPLFAARGGASVTVVRWIVPVAIGAAAVVYGSVYARRVPRFIPIVVSAAGVVMAAAAR